MTTFEATLAARSQAPRPFAVAPKKRDLLDYMVRAAVVQTYAYANRTNIERAHAVVAQKHPRYSDELTKLVCRAATSPASTYVDGWAAEFVVAEGADLIAGLMPRSAFAQLAAYGMHLTFSVGDILVPDFIPSTAGMFVRQGDPIPVIQGQMTGQILTRKKLACIVSYSGELSEGAIVTLEGILQTRIQESAGLALDSVLLDDQPATDARPAGLLNGAVEITSSSSMQSDLQLLAEGLYPLAGNHVRVPILIMNSAQAFGARVQSRDFAPVIVSPSLEPGTVIMLDAADFACAGGQFPRFEVSKESALHFEDAAPEHINAGAMANPVKSLWQEELLGLRMILETDWCLRRPGVACYMKNVRWKLGGT